MKPNLGSISEINKLQEALVSMSDEIEASKKKLEINIDNLEDANKRLVDTQRELVASEKMASLGKLSAGVAHEIGNPLSAISGYMEILGKGHQLNRDQTNTYLEKYHLKLTGSTKSSLHYSITRNPGKHLRQLPI